jgi:hypothetical protein
MKITTYGLRSLRHDLTAQAFAADDAPAGFSGYGRSDVEPSASCARGSPSCSWIGVAVGVDENVVKAAAGSTW